MKLRKLKYIYLTFLIIKIYYVQSLCINVDHKDVQVVLIIDSFSLLLAIF